MANAAPRRQRTKKTHSEVIAHVKATFNNTMITITTRSGEVLCRASAGEVGFKGARKGTPYAAQLAAEKAAKTAGEKYGVRRVEVRVRGPGAGRDSAIRALNNASGMVVTRLEDVTPLPHNGCRPRKKRRV